MFLIGRWEKTTDSNNTMSPSFEDLYAVVSAFKQMQKQADKQMQKQSSKQTI